MILPQQFAYGRKKHDPARVAQVEPHRMAAEAPAPAELPRPSLVWTPSLVRNNVLSTCVVAALVNSARLNTLLRQPAGFDLVTAEASLLRFFASCVPCADTEEAMAAADGVVMLEALERAAGGFDVGEQAPLVPSFRSIDVTSAEAIRDAIFTRGSALLGVTLHEADVQPGLEHWSGDVANSGPVVGGHAILGCRYTAGGFSVATWGGEMPADDAWVLSRLGEAYAPIWSMQLAP